MRFQCASLESTPAFCSIATARFCCWTRSGMCSSIVRTCPDTSAGPQGAPSRMPPPPSWRRSTARRSGPPASPTSAAGTRAEEESKPRAAAASTTGLRRRAARAVLQGHAARRVRGPGEPVAHPPRRAVERAGAGAGAGDHRRGEHRRLHDRQRHELPRHRGREPALPAAGQDLRRLVRARPGVLFTSEPLPPDDDDRAADRPRRRHGLRGQHDAGADAPHAGGAGRLALSARTVPRTAASC